MKKKQISAEQKRMMLERYFEDLKKLFLRRFNDYEILRRDDVNDAKQLQALLEEIIYIKSTLGQKEV